MCLAKGRDHTRQETDRERRKGGDPERAGRHVADVFRYPLQGRNTREASLDFVEKGVGFGRHGERAAARTQEELKAQLMLELGKHLAHRGLRQVERLDRKSTRLNSSH